MSISVPISRRFAAALIPALGAILPAPVAAQISTERRAAPVNLHVDTGKLELTATWERLTDTVYKFEKRFPLVANLKPAVERVDYDASQFGAFLPSEPVSVGDSWRFNVNVAMPFLRQFHPGATGDLHHSRRMGERHGWACLRAVGPRFAEVRLRIHAEFVIGGTGERGQASSWFTPAQFAGRMIIDRRSDTVIRFTLGVPDQSANVDLNIASGERVSADIGRVPQMDLVGGTEPAEDYEFAEQVSVDDAEGRLARAFYPFAEIEWLDLAAARAKSIETGKPLHVIALFGSLLDESC